MELTETKFKQTEIGLIPEDWEVCTLKSITNLMTNGFVGVAKTQYVDSGDGVLYIQGYNVKENGFNFHGVKKVNNEFHLKNSKSNLREGDLLTVQTGDVGLTTIVSKELEGSNCHALIITRFKKHKAFPKYFAFYLNSFTGRERLREIETGTTMKHINVGDMIHFEVPIPPTLEEQKAIAQLLSDTDNLIQAIEQKLAKKRAIKQGAMQRLLTPKNDWEVKKLGDYVRISSGESPSKFTFISEGIPYFKVEQLNNSKKYQCETPYHIDTNNIIPKESIIFPKRGASILLNKVRILKQDSFMDTNLMTLTISPELNNEFIYYMLISIELWRIADTTSIPQINNKHINSIEFSIPSIKEQIQIAAILSDMDAEIAQLEQKLSKYKMLKQGLMQNLLTGKIRLV